MTRPRRRGSVIRSTRFGAANALEMLGVTAATGSSMTVGEWVQRQIDHKSGVQADTVAKYQSHPDRDIGQVLGGLPLTALTPHRVAVWVNFMREPDLNGKVALTFPLKP